MEIPTGYAQANIKFTGAAVPTGAEMTLGLDVGAFLGSPLDAATLISAAWGSNNLDARQVEDIQQSSVLVKFGPTATGPSAEYTNPWTGTVADDAVAPNTAVLVQKVTALGGRAGRGRMYFPGVSEAEIGGSGVVDNAFVGNLQTALDGFYDDLAAANLDPVLLHGEGSPITVPTPMTSFQVSGLAATQRRRLRR